MKRLFLAGLVAMASIAAGVLGPGKAIAGGPVAPYAAADFEIDQFYDALAPYGDWVAQPRYGYVWYPHAVDPDWRPFTVGNWVYTDDYGWYWDSPEPFAWAVYHYGRWGYDRDYGWYWVPGDTWSPAWVQWRYSDDYVGWAPEAPVTPIGYGGYGAPYGGYYGNDWAYDGYGYDGYGYDGYGSSSVGFGFSFGRYGYDAPRRYARVPYARAYDAWTFVRPRHLVAPRVRSYAVPRTSIAVVFNSTKNVYRPRYRNGYVYNAGMPRAHWSRVTKRRLNGAIISAGWRTTRAPTLEGPESVAAAWGGISTSMRRT
ncbi:hypothetical protein AUC68_12890 [Methyloceanibacter methanicus]|uniref:BcpO-related WXXGXW repeat protein n=1 Tax=Methyloceanibacter methanicus TaxID=1774968 RepID=A0A1E3W682_9HYPH|nr:DUF6600 domain-containing protein [Methyloceanibacter methanicus]ODS01250.1 hypothetical protein AUC68_12890 [Methyloceanibacter methanicus]